jgi:hypothetical protein
LRTYRTRDPRGDNTFGSRCAGAFCSALFGLPLAGAWWLWLNHAAAGTDMPFPFRYAACGVGALAMFGFAFPRVVPEVYGASWRALSKAWWWIR